MKELYHITSWENIPKKVGDTFTLRPGPQCAEGEGVFFSEGKPRPAAADGTHMGSCSAVIQIAVEQVEGWWRTKNSIVKKHNRPRTWHSDTKKIQCRIESMSGWGRIKCSWEWA